MKIIKRLLLTILLFASIGGNCVWAGLYINTEALSASSNRRLTVQRPTTYANEAELLSSKNRYRSVVSLLEEADQRKLLEEFERDLLAPTNNARPSGALLQYAMSTHSSVTPTLLRMNEGHKPQSDIETVLSELFGTPPSRILFFLSALLHNFRHGKQVEDNLIE